MTVKNFIDLIINPILPSNIFINKPIELYNINLSPICEKDYNLIITGIEISENNPKIILNVKNNEE